MIEPNGIDITPKKDGGVLKEIIKQGNGTEGPLSGDNVVVHYTGTLLDGSKFDSSRDRNEKFKFIVDKGQVIKGWDVGILTMKIGEQSRFFIRSDYGYGDSGSGDKIPPKATLVFDIELFEFYGEDISANSDKSLIKRIKHAGEGFTSPNDGASVDVHLKGFYQNNKFDERDVTFEIGEGIKYGIINGIEETVMKMKKGEISRASIKSYLAWGKNGNEQFNIPPDSDVEYEITLKNFEKAKESWQMDSKEKLEQSEILKAKGTELFKENKFVLAIKKYKKIVDLLENESFDSEDEKLKSKQLQMAANLNIGACNLKLGEYRNAIDTCEKVLKNDSKNEKALFRIAQAYVGCTEYENAIKFFNQVVEINQNNKEAKQQISVAREKIKEYSKKEKLLYSKMFSALGKGKDEPELKENGNCCSNKETTNGCC